MNVEAWQAQQKAQKDEERQRKTQAAEALRSYRSDGLSQEDTKLTAIREQERKQKEEAERQLRGYRGTMSEEDTKLAALREEERRKRQEAELQLRGYGLSSNSPPETSPKRDDYLHTISAGAVSGMADKFSVAGEAAVVGNNNENGDADTQPMMASTEPEVVTSILPVTSDIAFRFGIISMEDSPSLDGYLATIDQLVTSTVGEETKKSMAFEYPSFKSVDMDASFMDPTDRIEVTRRVATISIPFASSNLSEFDAMKAQIIEAVRVAVGNGSLQKRF